jgi:hypothetical protein
MAQTHYRIQQTALKEPVRNKFFYGKLLDVFHLELETNYVNDKRWLLNRLVVGPGVVCGLDVESSKDKKAITVQPGVAIDSCGREIIVTQASQPVPLLPFPPYPGAMAKPKGQHRYQGKERRNYCEEEYAHAGLCYRECDSDPVPVIVSDCEVALCAAGSIRERYEVQIKKGYAPERKSTFPDMIEGGRISYHAIVDWVTKPCRALPDDCCIPLANILLRDAGDHWEPEIDIYIRPIIYTNRLLFDLTHLPVANTINALKVKRKL